MILQYLHLDVEHTSLPLDLGLSMTCFDQHNFSQYVANRGIKRLVMAGLAFLHFCHHYKRNKPQVACKLQEDEIHMEKTYPSHPTDHQPKGELPCQLTDSGVLE